MENLSTKCSWCGAFFERKSKKKITCSDSCRDRLRYHSNADSRERKKEQALRWYHDNRGRVRDRQKEYYKENYTYFAARNLSRGDRTLSPELVATVMKEDDYTCQYCGQRGGKLTIDHKDPVSRGGSDDRSNLCVACHRCNCRKGAKTVAEFVEYLQSC